MKDEMIDPIRDELAKTLSANWRNMHTNESLGMQRMLADAILAEFTVSRRTADHAELITEAKALADRATPGPWAASSVESIGGGTIYDGEWSIATATIYNHDEPLSDRPDARGPGYINTDANAVFIARARTLVPELVAALEAVTK